MWFGDVNNLPVHQFFNRLESFESTSANENIFNDQQPGILRRYWHAIIAAWKNVSLSKGNVKRLEGEISHFDEALVVRSVCRLEQYRLK